VYYNTDKDDQALAKFKKWQLIFRELQKRLKQLQPRD
jgi:hypothetical protein